MPSYLKALVTISVWILFVAGCLAILLGIIFLARRADSLCLFSAGVVSVLFSVIAAWFRKKIE